jgi:hypothetical protein
MKKLFYILDNLFYELSKNLVLRISEIIRNKGQPFYLI